MYAAVDSGCNESAQPMHEPPNNGVCRLPRKFTALWRSSGDRRALSTHAPLAIQWFNSLLVTHEESGSCRQKRHVTQ
jgi:hypothetical protein